MGKPVVLEPFQRRFILEVYDNPHGTRRAYLSIARKNAKTATIAFLVLAHLASRELAIENSRIVSGAMSKEQAAEVFNYASKVVRLSPVLSNVVRIVPSGKRLIGLQRNVEYQAISAEGKTAHGKSPVVAILDELGQVRGPQSDFVDAITTAQGAYDNALLFAISTQAPNDNDLFSIWLDDAKTNNDVHTVCHVYAAPESCALDDESAWAAANPALGRFRSLADMRDQAEKAKRLPSFEPTFRNLCLNQRVVTSNPLVSRNLWDANGSAPAEVFHIGEVFLGIDLSGKNDLTSMVAVCLHEGKIHVKPFFWTPESGLRERARRDRAPYDVWVEHGYIKALPGASIDYKALAYEIASITGDMSIAAAAFDRWRFDILQSELGAIGCTLPLVPFGQGFKDMSPAIEALETALLNEKMCHGGHPVLTMCMANARAVSDPAGNRKLDKTKTTGRIDGAVALAMAVGTAMGATRDPERDYQMFFI
jgi:phage terminase large subunit-like protein